MLSVECGGDSQHSPRLASLTAVAELGSEELGGGSGLQQRRGQAPAQQPRHGGVGSRATNTLATLDTQWSHCSTSALWHFPLGQADLEIFFLH